MSRTIDAIEGTSSERSRLIHILRTLTLVVPMLALTALAGSVAASDGLLGPTGGQTLGSAEQEAVPTAPVEPRSPTRVADDRGDAAAGGTITPAMAPSGDAPTADGTEPTTLTVEVPVAGASRLVTGPAERLVDTRPDPADDRSTPTTDPAIVELPAPADLAAGTDPVTGLVLSVSLVASTGPGTVTAEGPYGSIDAVTVGGPGASTTALIVVPGSAPSQLVNPTGGHLVVDLVGRFVDSGAVAEGRFVTTTPTRLGRLVTASDGREARIDLGPAIEAPAAAALVLITADVGDDGGRIGLGPTLDGLDQMLMWGPPAGPNRQRSGIALVTADATGRFALRYDGGSVLDVDLLGYTTTASAPVSTDGLFVPASSILTVERTFPAGSTRIDGSPAGVGAAFVGLRAAPGADTTPRSAATARDLVVASGRTIGTVLPVEVGTDRRPTIVVDASTELDARLQVFGHFLDLDR